MIGIVPVAGKSSRFKKAGYKTSKIFLPLRDGRPMLQHVIESMGLPPGSKLYLIGDGTDQDVFDNLIPVLARMRLSCVWTVIWSEGMIDPLDTLTRANEFLVDSDDRMLINYADVFLVDGAQQIVTIADKDKCPAIMTYFRSDNPRFQKIGDGDRVRGGTFYFRYASDFVKGALKVTRIPGQDFGPGDIIEKISGGGYFECILGETMIDLGTPQDYEEYLKAKPAEPQ